ncbi:MAG: hypothetical protein IJU72_07860 [Bacteroidales bacterium]|nr:hypothetical protein [Bacteroidales bacterium]
MLHSLSPQLFNAAFVGMGINARYLRIRPAHVSQIVDLMRAMPLAGANITTPFKADVMPHLSWIAPEAMAIGGVNVVVNDGGRLLGYNTDYIGAARSLAEAGCELGRCRSLVLGAGPAAAAAAYGLRAAGAEVYVANRTHGRAAALARRLGCCAVRVDELRGLLPQLDVLVSALRADANMLHDVKLRPGQWVLDANYKRSPLLEQAHAKGCRVVSGRRWLLHQALPAIEQFCGGLPDMTALEAAVERDVDCRSLVVSGMSDGSALRADLLVVDVANVKAIADEEIRCAIGD